MDGISWILIKKISDHQPYFILLKTYITKKSPPKFVEITTQSQQSLSNFKHEVILLNLHETLNKDPSVNPNENYKVLISEINQAKEKHLTNKVVKFRKDKHKNLNWITTGIIKSINYRDKLYKHLKIIDVDTPQYTAMKLNLKTYNVILKRSIKQAKQLHFTYIFNKCENDIKKTWITINSLLRKTPNSRPAVPVLVDKDISVRNTQEIVNAFNTYFTNIGPQLASNLQTVDGTTHQLYLNEHIESTFEFHPVAENDINKIIDQFPTKTSAGVDGISLKHVKLIKSELVAPLAVITNQILKTGTFPNELKVAKVIPIFKKGDKTHISNYRPISLLPVFSKVIERVIYNQLYNYFTNHTPICSSIWF